MDSNAALAMIQSAIVDADPDNGILIIFIPSREDRDDDGPGGKSDAVPLMGGGIGGEAGGDINAILQGVNTP